GPEAVLRDHLPEPHERLHHGGMVARPGEVQRLPQSRYVEAIDRAGRSGERGLQPLAADIGIRLDLRDPLVLQVDEALHAAAEGGGLARESEIDEFLCLLLAEA